MITEVVGTAVAVAGAEKHNADDCAANKRQLLRGPVEPTLLSGIGRTVICVSELF